MATILGISGSIAAYKAVDLMRFLQENGHQLAVVLTANACRFIAPLTFETFVPGRVYRELFSAGEPPLLHLNLAAENDLLLVAPASANIIGKFACGIADDLLSTLFLAFDKRKIIAPAMHPAMYSNPIVQKNLAVLRSAGVGIVEPDSGKTACGASGKGKMASREKIWQEISAFLSGQ